MLVHKLRFKTDDGSDFPEWEEKKIGELGTFIKGASLSKADISECGSLLILYGELYTTYKEVAYNIQRKTQAVVEKKYYSCVGDVIIPTSGESAEEISTATCVMVPDVILGGDLNIFRSDIVDGRVMSYILNHQAKWKIATIAQGKSIVHIQAKQLSNIGVKYPVSKVEQQKIAEFFSIVDTVIEKQKETVSAWEERKKGVMQKLFSQEVRFKADDGNDFPEWEEKKLGEVGDIMTGNTPSTKQEDYYGGCYLWVTPADITDSREVSVTAKKLTELGYTVARHIPANSVLVTCIASIGKNAIIRENGSCNQQINSITPYNDYSVEFVYYLICQNERLLHANAGTGGMEILNKDSFSKIKMYFPCLEEQQKIVDCLSSLDEVIAKQKATLAAWEELKKGLLQQMFV